METTRTVFTVINFPGIEEIAKRIKALIWYHKCGDVQFLFSEFPELKNWQIYEACRYAHNLNYVTLRFYGSGAYLETV
jgi:hypothetical protein